MNCRLLLFALVVFLPFSVARADQGKPSKTTSLVADGAARCVIAFPKGDALTDRAANRLADYFKEQTGSRPSIVPATNLSTDTNKTLIVIDGSTNHELLGSLGIQLDVPTDRTDAYHLRVVPHNDGVVVAIAGHAPSGAKFGVYRLMEEMEMKAGTATVGDLDLIASPFFKTRSVSLFNIWRVPVEVIRQCNLESWPAEKVAQNVDMYDAFGFNALETHDRFHEDFLKAVYGLSRAEWRKKVYGMCDRAHEDGMTVFLRQWGNSVALPVKELKGGYTPFGYVNLVPDIPEERQRWNAEIRDYTATNYAAHVDHLIGHWADASGIHEGSHATIKDAMLLHNELRAAFRAINPKIETSFNLWNMANPRGHRSWPGYVDHRSVTTAGVLEKDVIIAQATRANSHRYSAKVTQEILADGYRAAVWSWRRADTEVRLGDAGLRIRIHGVVGDYFHGLPESAREIEWHNIERNHHGIANDVNYYVASRLMWDPKADVDAALAKYCALVFGGANEKAVAEAFLTIEASRDVENQVSKYIVGHPAEGARRARAALAALSNVKLPQDHHSRLPSVTSPGEMLTELRGTLAIIAENAELCAEQLPAIDRLLEAGKRDEARAISRQLQKKADAWFGTIAGGVEGLWLKETLQAKLEPGNSDKSKKWFGFHTRNVEVFENKASEYLIGGQGKTPATALLDFESPARGRVEFHFQATVATAGKSRNAGLVFGSSLNADDLVRCQAFIGGNELRLRGKNLAKPRTATMHDIDPTRPLDCTVTVDPQQHSVIFKVGNTSITAELNPSVQAIRYYGYIVENTKTHFGNIEVKQGK